MSRTVHTRKAKRGVVTVYVSMSRELERRIAKAARARSCDPQDVIIRTLVEAFPERKD